MKTRKLFLLVAGFMLFALTAKAQQYPFPTDTPGFGYGIINNSGFYLDFHVEADVWVSQPGYGIFPYHYTNYGALPYWNNSAVYYTWDSEDSVYAVDEITVFIHNLGYPEGKGSIVYRKTLDNTNMYELHDPVIIPYHNYPGWEAVVTCTRLGNFWVFEFTYRQSE
jgi:hypothetical protein